MIVRFIPFLLSPRSTNCVLPPVGLNVIPDVCSGQKTRYSLKTWVRMSGPLPKTLAYRIYDLTKTLIPYLFQTCLIISSLYLV